MEEPLDFQADSQVGTLGRLGTIRSFLRPLYATPLEVQRGLESAWIQTAVQRAMSEVEAELFERSLPSTNPATPSLREQRFHINTLHQILGNDHWPAFAALVRSRMSPHRLKTPPTTPSVPKQEYEFWKHYLQEHGTSTEGLEKPCDTLGVQPIPDHLKNTWVYIALTEVSFGWPSHRENPTSPQLEFGLYRKGDSARLHINLRYGAKKGRRYVSKQGLICETSFKLAHCLSEQNYAYLTHKGTTDNPYIHQKYLDQGWVNAQDTSQQYSSTDDYQFIVPNRGFYCINRTHSLNKGFIPNRMHMIDQAGNAQTLTLPQ